MGEFFELAILLTFVVTLTGSLIAAVAHFAVSGAAGTGPHRATHAWEHHLVPIRDYPADPQARPGNDVHMKPVDDRDLNAA